MTIVSYCPMAVGGSSQIRQKFFIDMSLQVLISGSPIDG